MEYNDLRFNSVVDLKPSKAVSFSYKSGNNFGTEFTDKAALPLIMERLPTLQELCLPGCLLTVTSSLSTTNVWSVRRQLMFPWYTNNNSIKFVIDTFMCDHFIEISQTDQILSLDEGELHWLFDNQDIKACEGTMLHCLLRWYKHQEPDREKVFKDLFSKIHLSMIPREYLWSAIKKYGLVKVMPKLIVYIVSKLEGFRKRINMADSLYQQNLSNIALIGKTYDSSQPGYTTTCYMGLDSKQMVTQVFSNPDHLYFVQFLEKLLIFSSVKKSSHGMHMSDMSQEHSIEMCMPNNTYENHFSQLLTCPGYLNRRALTIQCGMFVFFLGGVDYFTRGFELNEVHRYDTVNDEWKQMAPMIHTHSFLRTIAIPYKNRYIFVFGPTNSDKYDIYTNKWSAIQSTPEEISALTTGHTINDKLCLFGKRKNWEMSDKCFIYDPLTDTWHKELDSLPSFCVTKSFLGKSFSFHRKCECTDSSQMQHRPSPSKFIFSEFNPKKNNLIPLDPQELDWDTTTFFMIMLSRRARMYMEHNRTLQHNTNIGQHLKHVKAWFSR